MKPARAIREIVVTAEFREARLQDTPIAITAVNAEMLEARGQTDISQIAAQAPNVSLRPQPQGGGTGLIAFIRGVGQVDFNYALDPGVGVYIDDVFIPTLSSSLLELMDLDRVEVLRGPQGTLAGKNSIGGAIKLFSARPDGSGEGSGCGWNMAPMTWFRFAAWPISPSAKMSPCAFRAWAVAAMAMSPCSITV